MSFDKSSSFAQWYSSVSSSNNSTRNQTTSSITPSSPWAQPRTLSPLDTTSSKIHKHLRSGPSNTSASINPASRYLATSLTQSRVSPAPSANGLSTSNFRASTLQGLTSSATENSVSTSTSQGVHSPTASSFQKISIAQLSILFDANSGKEGKSDKIKKLLETNGSEVFAVFIRKAVLLNTATIFESKTSSRHAIYDLLGDKISEIRQDPIHAFHIVDATSAGKEDLFRTFDVAKFVGHFLQDQPAQLILAAAFTSSSRDILRDQSAQITQDLCLSLCTDPESARLNLEKLSLASLAYLNTTLALELQGQQSTRLFEPLLPRNSASAVEIVKMAQLYKLPDRDRQIIDAFKKSGPRSAASKQGIEDVLKSLPTTAFVPAELGNALLFMLFAQPQQHYNLDEFVTALKAQNASRQVSWNQVVATFDIPELYIPTDSFVRLLKALSIVAASQDDFDIQSLWGGQWRNPQTQSSFLRAFFEMPNMTPSQIPGFQAAFDLSEFDQAPAQVREHVAAALETQHCNLHAMKAVFDVILGPDTLADEVDDASSLLHDVVKNHLSTFLLSLGPMNAMVNNLTPVQEKFLDSSLRVFLEDQRPESDAALEALFHQDRRVVSILCINTFHMDPRRTDIIARKAKHLGWTTYLLEAFSTPLALDIACLTQKENPDFDLEQWISRNVDGLSRSERMVMGTTLWKFLRIKADDEYRFQKEQFPYQSVPLSLPAAYILLWKVQDLLEDREQIRNAQTTCFTTYPRLLNYGTEYDAILEQSSEIRGHRLAPDTDVRMSELFGRMYRQELEIRDMINEMRRYKTSDDPQLQDLFCCIVHGLFDEYGCYGEYPEEALEKTALVFGNIVNYRLLPPIPQDYGLTLIVDAVKEHRPDTPMHRFGIEALLQVGEQLMEWPEICVLLLSIPTLEHPEILQRAKDGVRRAQIRGGQVDRDGEDFGHLNGNTDEPRLEIGSRGFRHLRADPPDPDFDYSDPDQKAQEKILFVINNLSKENMELKLTDLHDVLKPEHYQWFASYLVEQRARLELNNQYLYKSFLLLLDDSRLSAEVLRETYVAVVKTMSAKATLDSQVERTHLKNLGTWLGSLTLARDQPIRHRNIYFLDLLLEAFETQRLIIVIPFTCKVLVEGKESTVFRPPNPWLEEILGVLLELYHFADLKLNLKFDIEVLCRELGLDYKDVEPSTTIREYQSQQAGEEIAAITGMENIDEYDLTLRGGRLRETFTVAEIMQALPDLSTVLRYPPPSGNQQEQNAIKQIINKAVQRAIEEIIAPVVERSITIASLSTSQLVSKDYSTEGNADNMATASKEMVKSLAGSLALVTCKEPLRMSIQNYIRQYVEEAGGIYMAEGQILMTVNDNLDVAANLVRDAAEQRAVPEMDQVIEPELADRRRFATEAVDGELYGQSLNRWSTWIPSPYKMEAGGLNESQRAVYEDFGPRVHGMNIGHIQNGSTDSTGRQFPDILNDALAMPNLSTPSGQPVLPHQSPNEIGSNSALSHRVNGLADAMPPHERVLLLFEEGQKATRASTLASLHDLGDDPLLASTIQQMLMLLRTSAHSDLMARQLAEKATSSILRQPPQNKLEAAFLALLFQKLCSISEAILRDIMRWITANEESLLGSAVVAASFLTAGLMEFSRVDGVISVALREHSEVGLRLLHDLMDHTLFSEDSNALRADFVSSIVALYAWLKEEPDHPIATEISGKLKAHGVPEYVVVALNDSVKAKEDQMLYVFKEWASLHETTSYNEITHASFLRELLGSQLINSAEDMVTFLRLSIETSIEAFEIEAHSFRRSVAQAFRTIDALAFLIILLVRFQGEANGAVKMSKPAYLESILSLTVLIVNSHQELRGVNFNQRVFTRLYGSILHSYAELRLSDTDDHVDFMFAFAKTFRSLQPSLIPVFAFGWTSLLSHRVLVEGVLRSRDEKCTTEYRDLLGLMLQYATAALEIPTLRQDAEVLTRGMWKNFYVIQNDFSQFIATNHAYFCARTSLREPSTRNVIASAQPFGMEEPNPLTPNLRVEQIADMKKAPVMNKDYVEPLEATQLLLAVQQGLKKTGDLDTLVKQIMEAVKDESKNQPTFAAPALDAEVLEALVMFVAQDTFSKSTRFDVECMHVQLLIKLLYALGPKQKYLLLSAIFDQLRYPNWHTQFCLKLVLHIWGSNPNVSDEEAYVREMIIRLLRERIDTVRPSAWGVIILFKELSDNSSYGFWDTQPFVHEPELRQRLMLAARAATEPH